MPHATPEPDLLRKAGLHDVPFDWADALRRDDLLTPEQRMTRDAGVSDCGGACTFVRSSIHERDSP